MSRSASYGRSRSKGKAENCVYEQQQSERNLELLERRNEELRALVEIGKALTSSLDLQEILNVIMEKVSLLLKPHSWSLLLVDEASGDLVYEIAVSPAAERLKGVRLTRGEGVAGWVAMHGESRLIPDIRADGQFPPVSGYNVSPPLRSVLCVPVKSKNRILGVVELVNTVQERCFDEADLTILSTIADYAAIAIENARYFQKVNELAITDGLTGLYNSRHLHNLLDYEVARASRYEADLSLVFIDLDHFKNVNDTYGHLVGSRLLTEVGNLVLRHIRKVDIAARYGGDEFVIVLPNISKAGAYRMSAKLRKLLNGHVFLADEGFRINITASFGIASLPEDARTKIDLISLADKAMYEVKATSRDGIKMY
ncbi:MAG: sensor domain-containing diguanylate cyclase [Geobacteraceae bacterium]|nr:sensor domain-containing diguanylate cyclase [Geobacteraceae bacterium]